MESYNPIKTHILLIIIFKTTDQFNLNIWTRSTHTESLVIKCFYVLTEPYQNICYLPFLGFPGGASGKEPSCQWKRHRRHGFDPWVGTIPWRRAWQPTPVFLSGESHGRRILAGYSPRGLQKSGIRLKWLPFSCLALFYQLGLHSCTRQDCSLLSLNSHSLLTILPLGRVRIF